MFARSARLDCEELVEGENARFAAFPAYRIILASSLHLVEFMLWGSTFLPLVEDWRAGMVDALFILILVRLAAALVHALLRHICCREALSEWWEGQLRAVTVLGAPDLPCCSEYSGSLRPPCHRGPGAKLNSDHEAFLFRYPVAHNVSRSLIA
jgi:hypothetical protein